MAHDPAAIDTHAAARTRHAVLIVDDHPLYRAGLKAALAPLALHVAEAASLLAALDVVGAHRSSTTGICPKAGASRGWWRCASWRRMCRWW